MGGCSLRMSFSFSGSRFRRIGTVGIISAGVRHSVRAWPKRPQRSHCVREVRFVFLPDVWEWVSASCITSSSRSPTTALIESAGDGERARGMLLGSVERERERER